MTKKNETGQTTILRPPIVVVLGHVDHGKTSLLDKIRETDTAGKEHGGITQKIGAYQITLPNEKKITFIDTPGHEAFTKMRGRGAMVADIAILVVAANDSVMPQTQESIKIIKEANIPFIVAINKIDLPEANVDKVIKDLLRYEVMLENYGGSVPYVKLSAKTGEGIKELLDLIGLFAEVNEIGKEDQTETSAVIIESKLDKNKGPVATVIVKSGILESGKKIFVGKKEEKIRALIDFNGRQINEAGPGMPAEIIGLSETAPVGIIVGNKMGDSVLETTSKRSDQSGEQSLSLILKADTLGSLEAIDAQIPANVNVISSGVGEISEKDILLAKSTGAIVLGFNNKITPFALKLAESEKVLARTYRIIYELLEELADAANGMLTRLETEEVLGSGEIIAEFPFENSRICGTKVKTGRIARGDLVKIMRGEEEVGKGKIKSIRLGKDEVTKMEEGKECGILIEPQIDFRAGDDIICYRLS